MKVIFAHNCAWKVLKPLKWISINEKAILNVTVRDTARQFGNSNPDFTVMYSGFKNGESDTVLDKLPTAYSFANFNSPLGTYPIEIGGGVDDQYAFRYQKGTLSVVDQSTSVGIIAHQPLRAYPNPVRNSLNLEGVKFGSMVTIFDQLGRQIQKSRLNGTTIDCSHLQPGIYLLQVDGRSLRLIKE